MIVDEIYELLFRLDIVSVRDFTEFISMEKIHVAKTYTINYATGEERDKCLS